MKKKPESNNSFNSIEQKPLPSASEIINNINQTSEQDNNKNNLKKIRHVIERTELEPMDVDEVNSDEYIVHNQENSTKQPKIYSNRKIKINDLPVAERSFLEEVDLGITDERSESRDKRIKEAEKVKVEKIPNTDNVINFESAKNRNIEQKNDQEYKKALAEVFNLKIIDGNKSTNNISKNQENVVNFEVARDSFGETNQSGQDEYEQTLEGVFEGSDISNQNNKLPTQSIYQRRTESNKNTKNLKLNQEKKKKSGIFSGIKERATSFYKNLTEKPEVPPKKPSNRTSAEPIKTNRKNNNFKKAAIVMGTAGIMSVAGSNAFSEEGSHQKATERLLNSQSLNETTKYINKDSDKIWEEFAKTWLSNGNTQTYSDPKYGALNNFDKEIIPDIAKDFSKKLEQTGDYSSKNIADTFQESAKENGVSADTASQILEIALKNPSYGDEQINQKLLELKNKEKTQKTQSVSKAKKPVIKFENNKIKLNKQMLTKDQ